MRRAGTNGHSPRRTLNSDISRRGRIEGALWANRQATFNELDRLADLDAQIGHDWAAWAERKNGMFALPQVMGSVPEGDVDATAAFWIEAVGPEWQRVIQDQDFIQGFVDGVLDVYAKVAGQMGHA